MFLEIKSLLNPHEVARLEALSRELKFVDGRVSNPANTAKINLQADMTDGKFSESVQIIGAAYSRSRVFKDFAFVKRMAPPLLCRYEPGMKYGAHADAPYVVVQDGVLRSDIASTVFISDPATYEGGELVVHLGTQPILFKGNRGDAVVYPSTMLHEVRPVLSGTRLVSITFIESLIADEYQRTQLHELNEIAALEGLNMRWESRVRLEVVRSNLMRMWSTG
jgi:PKHD-type hydroxylase